MLPAILAVLVVLLSFLLWRRWHHFHLFERLGIPGPKPSLYNGNLDEYASKGSSRCQMDWINTYGDLVGFFIGTKPYVMVADLETIKDIQVKNSADFINRNLYFDGSFNFAENMEYVLGNLKSQEWKATRSLLTPIFSSSKLKLVADLTNKIVDKFISKIEKNGAKPINLTHMIDVLVLDIILVIGMGIQLNVQDDPAVQRFMTQSMRSFFNVNFENKLIQMLVSFEALQPLTATFLKWKDKALYFLGKPSVNFIITECEKAIQLRKKSFDEPHQDMLQGILGVSEDNPRLNGSPGGGSERKLLSHGHMIANLALFLSGGQETTALTLVTMHRLLMTHPDIQEKIQAELKKKIQSDNEVSYNDIAQLSYLEQVIQEVLRIFPPAPSSILRSLENDVTLKGKKIPKQVAVYIPMWYLHRSNKLWNEQDKFDPERFSKQNKSAINPTTFQPFGNGPRICIGARFAQVVIKVIMAKILNRFSVVPVDSKNNEDLEFEYTMFIMRPKENLMGKFIAHQSC